MIAFPVSLPRQQLFLHPRTYPKPWQVARNRFQEDSGRSQSSAYSQTAVLSKLPQRAVSLLYRPRQKLLPALRYEVAEPTKHESYGKFLHFYIAPHYQRVRLRNEEIRCRSTA